MDIFGTSQLLSPFEPGLLGFPAVGIVEASQALGYLIDPLVRFNVGPLEEAREGGGRRHVGQDATVNEVLRRPDWPLPLHDNLAGPQVAGEERDEN